MCWLPHTHAPAGPGYTGVNPIPPAMTGSAAPGQLAGQLSYVAETDHGCLIYRETSGSYVVQHQGDSRLRRGIPTLAGAWAACHGLAPTLSRQSGGADQARCP